MSRDTLYVSPHQSSWQVRSDENNMDTDFPFYTTKEQAIDAALASAQNSAKKGRQGDVYVGDENGNFELERSFSAQQT